MCFGYWVFCLQQHRCLLGWGDLSALKLNLNYDKDIGANAFHIYEQQQDLIVSGLNHNVKSIAFSISHVSSPFINKGILSIKDEARAYDWAVVTNFEFLSESNQRLVITTLPHGKVKGINLHFTDFRYPFYITKLTLNEPPVVDFSLVRTLLTFLALALIYGLFKGKLRSFNVEVNSKGMRLVKASAMAVAVLMSLVIFNIFAPWNTLPYRFAFNNLGTIGYSTPNQSLLLDLPRNEVEVTGHDPFVQQLHAFLKGQTHLAFTPDARLAQLHNPYDMSERAANNISYLWDRVYYQGKMYSYFGLTPLATIYLPIYAVTGKVPAPVLASLIATLYSIFALYFLIGRLVSLMCNRVNALIYGLGSLSCAFVTLVFVHQAMFLFYSLPYMTAMASLYVIMGCTLSLFKYVKNSNAQDGKGKDTKANKSNAQEASVKNTAELNNKSTAAATTNKDQAMGLIGLERIKSFSERRIFVEMVIMGLAVVALVASRPLSLVWALLFVGVVGVLFLKSAAAEAKTKILVLACAGIPVLLGAIGLMIFNYVRFDSVFEFGQFLQLTVFDTHYNGIQMNFEAIKYILYKFFMLGPQTSANFPFIGNTGLPERAFGNHTFDQISFGMLTIPYMLGIFLIFCMFKGNKTTIVERTFKLITTATIPLSVILAIVIFFNAGVNLRYLSDITMFAAPLILIMFLRLTVIDAKSTEDCALPSSKVEPNVDVAQQESLNMASSALSALYTLIVFGCLVSIGMLFFTMFSEMTILNDANPHGYISVKEIFDPLSRYHSL